MTGVQTCALPILIKKVDHLTKRTHQSLMEEISAFAKISALKDKYNDTDFDEAVYCANKMAKQLRLPKEQIEQVKRAVLLRDLGKIGIDERILRKSSRLTNKEFKEIKMHPQLSTDIMKPIQFLYGIIPLIRYHHERWDGSGYPYGLKGERIPLGSRIVGLIAVYQALISDRPYRKAYSKDEVIEIITSGSGTQFDPKIVSVFLSILQNKEL